MGREINVIVVAKDIDKVKLTNNLLFTRYKVYPSQRLTINTSITYNTPGIRHSTIRYISYINSL